MDRNLTVLIAEDNENDALLLERAFRKLGLNNPVQVVSDGKQVIQYLKGDDKFANRVEFPFPSLLRKAVDYWAACARPPLPETAAC